MTSSPPNITIGRAATARGLAFYCAIFFSLSAAVYIFQARKWIGAYQVKMIAPGVRHTTTLINFAASPSFSSLSRQQLALGRELFYTGSSSVRGSLGKPRASCAVLDELNSWKEIVLPVVERTEAIPKDKGPDVIRETFDDLRRRGLCPFDDCMDDLEASQRIYRAAFPPELEPPCQKGEDGGKHGARIALYHVAWLSGGLKPHARLSLWSVVRAHPLGCVEVRLWARNEDHRQALIEDLRPYPELSEAVHVEAVDFVRLGDIIASVFPSVRSLMNATHDRLEEVTRGFEETDAKKAVSNSDLLRVFVLAAHGGIYIDLDVLLLRPLTPLMSSDFYYRWSTTWYCNTAVMYLSKGSPNALAIVKATLVQKEDMAAFLHPKSIGEHSKEMGLLIEMLPSAYFNPTFVMSDAGHKTSQVCQESSEKRYGIKRHVTGGFFTESNAHLVSQDGDPRDRFFPGAFAFHWHNQWNDAISEFSTGGIFLAYFEKTTS